jgi:cell division protein FtsI (penicillin-binding protein 3)
MNKHPIHWLKVRIFFVFCLFFLCFILLFLKVFHLQIMERERLQGLAERQHQRIIDLVPKRGPIYDRNLRVLAESFEIESLYAHPRQIENPSRVARQIARILRVRESTIQRKLESRAPFVWLQRKVSPRQAERIRRLGIKGINFLMESQRSYPNRSLAANLLGLVDIDSQGLEGIELQYDRYLRGDPRRVVIEVDARGGEIITEVPSPLTEVSSHSLVLTIDHKIQHIVEKNLSQAFSQTEAKSAMALVMAPRTGQILAMVSRPSFNPNYLGNVNPGSIRNRTITDIFEPGSIFKVFLLAAALEEKVVKENDIFFCHNGAYAVGSKIIHDHRKFGWLDLEKIIKVSSNIGASLIGLKVGADTLDRYIRSLGFGEFTGIQLPGEVKGIVRKPDQLTPVGVANTSFGQGISVTAIQLIAALSSIANGGTLIRPYVVDRIMDQSGGVVRSFRPQPRKRVLSAETCLEVTRIMKTVVEPGGTGTRAALAGYEVAGKTGTAQKIDPLLKQYTDDRHIASFMGFVPADDPRLAILVVIDEPDGSAYGGTVAAPVFRTIAQQILQYLNVPPTTGTVAFNIRKPGQAARGSGKREASPPVSQIKPEGPMPNLSGLSMRAALNGLRGRNLDIRITGRGVLREQNPHPGARLREGSICYLRFAPLS